MLLLNLNNEDVRIERRGLAVLVGFLAVCLFLSLVIWSRGPNPVTEVPISLEEKLVLIELIDRIELDGGPGNLEILAKDFRRDILREDQDLVLSPRAKGNIVVLGSKLIFPPRFFDWDSHQQKQFLRATMLKRAAHGLSKISPE